MASTKITRTSASSTEKKITISMWVRLNTPGERSCVGNTNDGSNWAMFYFNGAKKLQFASYIGGSYVVRYTTNRVFNDVGAWYHCVATADVSLSSPEVKIYVNGEEQTDLQYNVTPSQNADIGWFNAWNMELGVQFGSSHYLDGALADVYYIQGYIHPASTFGQTDATTGQWKPITSPSINYNGNGGNSFHLKFENSANMDLDSGSNNLSFVTSGTGLLQTQDNPSNVFCTWNDLKKMSIALSNGSTTTDGNGDNGAWGTIGDNQGKWYWETQQNANSVMMGVIHEDVQQTTGRSDQAGVYGLQSGNGSYAYYRNNGSSGNSSGFPEITNSNVLCHALDLDSGKYYLGINGAFKNLSGATSDIAAGTNPTFSGLDTTKFWFPFTESRGTGVGCDANFGNGFFGTTAISSAGSNASGLGNFEYDVPAGFAAWCTKGLNE